MNPIESTLPTYLAGRLPAIKRICVQCQVKYLYAIGSVLTEGFREDSDIDFLYDLDQRALKTGKYLHNLDGLISGLLGLFPGRKIDLIHYPSLRNPYFIEEVDETKVLLYEQDTEELPEWKVEVKKLLDS